MSQISIAQAIQLLNSGDVVAFPTETVYGLGARIDSEPGLKKIFSTKQRPFFDPLIVHAATLEQARSCYSEWPMVAQSLAEKFWPGPLTLVMLKSDQISDLITSGLPRVGVRIPRHALAINLIHQVGVPLAAPSANKFGKTSPTTAEHVLQEFGSDVAVLASQASDIGIESTVLLVKNNTDLAILRKGMILKSDIENHLNDNKISFHWVENIDKKESPGHMKHHYMPEIPFIICKKPSMKLSELSHILNEKLAEMPDVIENVKIIKPSGIITQIEFLNLSKDPTQAVREFYHKLRLASQRKPQALCFIQTPDHNGEIWETLFDRMYKAASLIVD